MTGTDFGGLSKKLRGGDSATKKEMQATPPKIHVVRRPNRKGLLGNMKIVRLFVGALNSRELVVTHNGNTMGKLLRENDSMEFTGIEGSNTIGVGPTEENQRTISVDLENGMRRRFFCGFSTGSAEIREG